MGASRPNKEHAYGEKNLPTAGNNTGASRLTTGAKELAYGEQNLYLNGTYKRGADQRIILV